MKKGLAFVFLLIGSYLMSNAQRPLEEKYISPNFEKFNVHFFNNISRKYGIKKKNLWGKTKRINTAKGRYIILYYYDDGTGYNYYEYDSNNTLKRRVTEWNDGFTDDIYTMPYRIYKDFYKNGNIRFKGVSRSRFYIGNVYYFFANGKKEKIENTDSGYRFNYERVVEYCKQNGIDILNKGDSVRVFKIKYENLPSWSIESSNIKLRRTDIIVLNGETGTIIKEYQRPFPSKH